MSRPRLLFLQTSAGPLVVTRIQNLKWVLSAVVGLGLLLALGLWTARTPQPVTALPSPGPDKPLVVYAYTSFTDFWGPGPKLVQQFQRECSCLVELVDAGDSAVLLERIKTEGNLSRADVVIGLDQNALHEALQIPGWHPLGDLSVKWNPLLPSELRRVGTFVAFDWAPMTFVYRKGEIEPPQTLEDLLDPRFRNKISLMDPRTSSGGLQFASWVISKLGPLKGREFFEKLKPNVMAISPSWSSAYGLFKKKQASLVFSYLTSPAYHWIEEKNPVYQAAAFTEPTPHQVEFAGVPGTASQPQRAIQFVKFLLDEGSQKTLAESNFMLPVIEGAKLHPAFGDLPQPVTGYQAQFRPEELATFVNVWKEVFR